MEENATQILKPDAGKIRTINKASYVDQRLMEAPGRAERVWLLFRRSFLRYYFVRPPLPRILLRSALSGDRMTPAFASLGAVRSGTSLFSDYLMQHPCVVLPLAKEIGLGYVPIQKLINAQFPSRRERQKVERKHGQAITGYCAPSIPYLAFANLAAEIAPDLRLIFLLRDPVDRAFAHWRWDQKLSEELRKDPLWRRFPDFDEAVRLELDSMRSYGGGLTPFSGIGGGGYLQHSIYLPFIKNVFQHYGRERALLINARDFFADPAGTARTAYRFLGLPDYEPVPMPVKNAGPPGAMSEAARQALRDFFRPLNQELYEYLGRDFGWQ
ncbi:MAG TPA: hypothetical protein VGP73_27495 [Thermoanaerobaculia bacterium]